MLRIVRMVILVICGMVSAVSCLSVRLILKESFPQLGQVNFGKVSPKQKKRGLEFVCSVELSVFWAAFDFVVAS